MNQLLDELLAFSDRTGIEVTTICYMAVAACLIYLMPALLATFRKKVDALNCWIVTVLLGWTVIGWIFAMKYALSKTECNDGWKNPSSALADNAIGVCAFHGGPKRWPFAKRV